MTGGRGGGGMLSLCGAFLRLPVTWEETRSLLHFGLDKNVTVSNKHKFLGYSIGICSRDSTWKELVPINLSPLRDCS